MNTPSKLLMSITSVELYLIANSEIDELPVTTYQTQDGEKYFDTRELAEYIDDKTLRQMQCIFCTLIIEETELTILN